MGGLAAAHCRCPRGLSAHVVVIPQRGDAFIASCNPCGGEGHVTPGHEAARDGETSSEPIRSCGGKATTLPEV